MSRECFCEEAQLVGISDSSTRGKEEGISCAKNAQVHFGARDKLKIKNLSCAWQRSKTIIENNLTIIGQLFVII